MELEPELGGWVNPVFEEHISRDAFATALARNPLGNGCDPLILRGWRRGWNYDVSQSPAVRLFFSRVNEDMAARCPPAHEKAKTLRHLRTWLTFGLFYYILLRADLFLHGKAVLTPKEVARYAFVQPKQDGDHLSDNLGGDLLEETKQIMVEKLGLAEADAEAKIENIKKHNRPLILRGGQRPIGTHFEEWDDDPARDGDLGKLRANDPEVSDHPVDWRPKARATVEIPYAAYPVVPAAARQRHWLTAWKSPLVTGRDAETKKPIVQFLRFVNTRASKKTELVKLLLHSLRAVLSRQDFEKIVNPEDRPYLKWFLTVKHPRGAPDEGAPDEYLQELRDLDDWRKGFAWACGSVAPLAQVWVWD
eukprot:g7969.t1